MLRASSFSSSLSLSLVVAGLFDLLLVVRAGDREHEREKSSADLDFGLPESVAMLRIKVEESSLK